MKRVVFFTVSLFFLVAGAFIGGGGLSLPFFKSQRNLASSVEGEDLFFKNLEVLHGRDGFIYLVKKNLHEGLCFQYRKLQYELTAEGVSTFAENRGSHDNDGKRGSHDNDGKIRLLITLDCTDARKTPVFDSKYCGSETKGRWKIGRTDVEFKNYDEFFPKSWYVSKVTLFNDDLSEDNSYEKSPSQEGLSLNFFKFGCALFPEKVGTSLSD